MRKASLFEKMKKHAVDANSIEEFFNKYHKPFEDSSWGKSARKEWVRNAEIEMKKYGYILIPSSATTTGMHATFYGKQECRQQGTAPSIIIIDELEES